MQRIKLDRRAAVFRILIVVLVLMAASVYAVSVINGSTSTLAQQATVEWKPKRSADVRTVVIAPQNGHFTTDGRVDGRPITFIVDTGATYISLRTSDAAALGYFPRDNDYVVRINTANGVGLAAPVELSMVEVGEITVRDVPALVVPDTALSVNLLGMSFLSRVGWTHERGELVLEQ